jgi:cytochrome c
MRLMRLALLVSITLALIATAVFAVEGSAERGKELFMDPGFAGGNKACNSAKCHPGGKGLEEAGTKKSFTIFNQKVDSLEKAVNLCIVGANKGKAIPEDSQDMSDIVAYIKSLAVAETPGYEAPSYGTPGYGAPGYGAPGYGTPGKK